MDGHKALATQTWTQLGINSVLVIVRVHRLSLNP
jgi:hypothetical protein